MIAPNQPNWPHRPSEHSPRGALGSIDLVRRRTLATVLADHYGLRLTFWPAWPGEDATVRYIDFQRPTAAGDLGDLRELDHDEYAEGHQVEEVTTGSTSSLDDRRRRLGEVLSRRWPFDLLRQNCEHVATYVVTGEAKSTQVRNLLLVLAFAGAAAVLHKPAPARNARGQFARRRR